MSARRWISSAAAVLVALGIAGAAGGAHRGSVQLPSVPEVSMPALPSVPGLGSISLGGASSATPVAGRAGEQLEQLGATTAAPSAPYSRDAFGQRWADVDRNGCDTRNDVLRRDLQEVSIKPGTNGCKVLAGHLQDPYTGQQIEFSVQDSQAVQIDHTVSLGDAWASGAWAWDEWQRLQFANDPENLLAVEGKANTAKSDANAAEWLPATTGGRCELVEHQIAVKTKWKLTVTDRERQAMRAVLAGCSTT